MPEATEAAIARRTSVTTGLDAFDSLTGGLPAGSILFLSGPPGSGSEIFAQQALYQKSKAGDAEVTYLTVDRPVEDVAGEMTLRGWDVDGLVAAKRWHFLDGFRLRTEVAKGAAGAKQLLQMLAKGVGDAVKQGQWAAIDTFSFYLTKFGFDELQPHLDELLLDARSGRGLYFLLGVAGLHDPLTLTRLAQALDGYLDFHLRLEDSAPIGAIRIQKLNRAAHVTRTIPYRIEPDGLLIETSVRVA